MVNPKSRNVNRLTAKIRAPLKKGEVRRYEAVPEDDPARQRLVYVTGLKKKDSKLFVSEKKKYVAEHIGLAITFARNLNAIHVPQEDLIHAATIGLLEAVDRFDVTKAGRFSTFAVWRMRYECDQLMNEAEGSIVKTPGQLRDDQRAVENAARKLSSLLGVQPDDAQLLEALRQDEQEKAEKKKSEGDNRAAVKHWAKASTEKVREVRETYAGVAYAQLNPHTPSEIESQINLRTIVKEVIGTLKPLLRAVVADEFDIEGVDTSLVPTCPVRRGAALQLALNQLRRKLESK